MSNINKKIDQHVKKENRTNFITAIITLIVVTPVILFFMFPNMGSTSQTTGVVIRLIGLPTDEGQNLFLIVKLKNGQKVRSYIPNSAFYKKDREVNIEKHEPLFFGKPIYRFRGYVKK